MHAMFKTPVFRTSSRDGGVLLPPLRGQVSERYRGQAQTNGLGHEVHRMLRAIGYVAATAIFFSAGSAQAAWPERNVTVVTPYAAGGIADVVARLTTERLSSGLKSTFVVENQPGAAGIAAPERVSKAAPDGYTLISTPIFQLTTAKFVHNVSFDATRDFTPIAAVASAPFVITVNESFPGN